MGFLASSHAKGENVCFFFLRAMNSVIFLSSDLLWHSFLCQWLFNLLSNLYACLVLPWLPGVIITCSKSAIDFWQLALFTLAKVEKYLAEFCNSPANEANIFISVGNSLNVKITGFLSTSRSEIRFHIVFHHCKRFWIAVSSMCAKIVSIGGNAFQYSEIYLGRSTHFFASLILSLSHNTVISDNATDNIFFRNFKLTFILIICNTTLSCKLLTLDM